MWSTPPDSCRFLLCVPLRLSFESVATESLIAERSIAYWKIVLRTRARRMPPFNNCSRIRSRCSPVYL